MQSTFLSLTMLLFSCVSSAQPTFEKVLPSPFFGTVLSDVAFADVDGDDDQDLLITGRNGGFPSTQLYLNDGMGAFTLFPETPFANVEDGAVAFTDIDGDTDLDLLLTGLDSSSQAVSRLYINSGTGSFTEVIDTAIKNVEKSAVAVADVDGDNDIDFILTGRDNTLTQVSKLYINNGNGNFSEQANFSFTAFYLGEAAFTDVDQDGDQDVFLSGRTSDFMPVTELYLNDGNGNFTPSMISSFAGVFEGGIDVADVNGDDSPDLLVSGLSIDNESITILYINDGAGQFTAQANSPFAAVSFGAVAFGDVNGDSAPEILLTGTKETGDACTELYINDGNGNFSLLADSPFEPATVGAVAFADVDGDEDQDVFITGRAVPFGLDADLFLNTTPPVSTIARTFTSRFHQPLYPNPNHTGQAFIDFSLEENKTLTFTVLDSSGREIQNRTTGVSAGAHTLPLELSLLRPGVYTVKISDASSVWVQKLVIQ